MSCTGNTHNRYGKKPEAQTNSKIGNEAASSDNYSDDNNNNKKNRRILNDF